MGRSLVRALLSHGDKCTAVGWTQENTVEQMEKWQQEKNCLGMLCDVRVRETVDHVIRKSIDHWGHMDIIAKYVSLLPWGLLALIATSQLHWLRYITSL